MEASSQDASTDLKSRDSSDFRLLPDKVLSEDSSEEDEVYTDPLTSHTTASDSTIGNLTSSLGPISSRVEEPNIVSKPESQFISSMPYLEDSTPLVVSSSDSHASADESVFVSDYSNNISSPISSPVALIPRSTRSTRGKPPEMERFIPLILWLTWAHIFNAHVTIVQINKLFIIITCGTINP